MDALADILKSIHLTASTDFCSEFWGPWGMDIGTSNTGVFHAVLDGHCYLNGPVLDDMIILEAGDIVAFPTGGAHWISDQPETKRLAGGQVVQAIAKGNNPFNAKGCKEKSGINKDSNVNLLCGSFSYDSKFKHPFLVDLPCFILVKAKDHQDLSWHSSLVQKISEETRSNLAGADLVVNNLCETLFVYLLRQYITQSNSDLSYMRALNDPQIGKALNLIHNEVEAKWSVEILADHIGLSRAAFSEKFTHLVKLSPKQYLTQWRMQKAKVMLNETNEAMIDIAQAAGYASEASFSKAFKAFFGDSPGRVRKSN
ncbi:AraC family transcriptional regulator [Agarilytica rhodophyticola]|uniref:AraC family transcriptional regulator n=1 Tax=Agarilytica rhodophyticola TaxID=1737490 RepID=UPI000B346403|nr:AraC family transcriptional regulator [Agarilytica rhodophyticola]